MPPKVKTAPSSSTQARKKGKNNERKRVKKRLKRWLETPEDWAKFDAWAEINAQPKKIHEPELLVRETRPLSQLKKRIQVLSLPMKKTDESAARRLNFDISKAALKAKPTKRIKELAMFIFKEEEVCREIPIKIRKAALRYEPSERIVEISRPLIRTSEKCASLEISQKSLKHRTTEREQMMALSKKAIECPDSLTDEEREKLMTPAGIMKSALTYEFTPWMSFLSLPSYRRLKDRDDKNAKTWKKKIVEESDTRGKKALEEKSKSEQKKKKDKRRKRGSDKNDKKEENEKSGTKKEDESQKEEPKDEEADGEKGENEDQEKFQEKEKNGKKRKTEDKEESGDKEKEAKRRREEKNSWRYDPGPYQEVGVKKSALKAKASERVKGLAKANVRKAQAYRENPFDVKRSALSASASARTSEMAKPKNPCEPVEKSPPREKDKFGKAIIPMPPYGKILPVVKYKKPKCKSNNEKEETSQKESPNKPLNPIVFESSIDPYLDPRRAKIQKNERKKMSQRKNNSDQGDK